MRADGDYGRDPFGKSVQEAEYGDRISTPEDRERLAPQIRHLNEHGYVIIENALSPVQFAAIRDGLDEVNSGTGFARSAFLGEKTQRPYGLLAKTKAVWPLAAHPDVVAVCEGHMDDQIQLSSLTAATLHPGQPAQTLHRDDGFYNLPDPHPPLSVSSIWALDDFTAENGGTLLVPGSHNPPTETEPPARAVNVEMKAGSVLLWTGATWHGGGANVSIDQVRRGVIILYCRAWLRQQENQYLAVPRETVREMPRVLQRLAGWWVIGAAMGFVEGRSPLRLLDH
ncbi:MAG: phytanoyl-CoA dioxygenase family protein [Alphaproteobacteria bacterium]|nr:phytanoyl-CoA dioxygenase family protein [Alphaproteobacteria bacterium]